MTLDAGTKLGPYEIVAPLGAGGMGEVYRARDTRLARDVAVKVLPASVAGDPERRARFEQEAKAVAALSHPNILAIFDVGTHGDTAYAVTELLEGETLRARLGQGPLPIRRATEIATQIARGLTAAHDKGLVHRDLKPENVFLLRDGQVKILDFGLAKATSPRAHDGETIAATDPGTVLGTVGYMAPEQVRGETVDARADLFALGAVLYEMLSGRRAFQRGTAAETMTAILKEDPPELTASRADLPPALDTVVRHCLERDPSDRFQSARDLAFNLQSASHASGSGPAARVPLARRRIRWREAAAWISVAALAAALTYAVPRTSRPEPAVGRFQILAPDQTTWAAPIGAPDGSNGGSISPDGTMLAFVVIDASAKPLLWVRDINSFTARPLAGTDGAAFPFWSPDSRFIGFLTQTRLKKVPAQGGPVQTLFEQPSTMRGATWGSQGDIVISTSGGQLSRLSADATSTAVSTREGPDPSRQWPFFLPDGRHFLYYSTGTRAIHVGSLESPDIKRIVPSDTNAIFVQPGRLLFMREGTLFAQSFDTARLEVTGDPEPVAEQVAFSPAPWNVGAFSASNAGTITYRRSAGVRSQLSWFDRSGKLVSSVGQAGNYLSPALSPDEARVAYARSDETATAGIWMLDLGRQTASRFSFGGATDIYPVWSPDGLKLYYQSTLKGLMAGSSNGTGATAPLLSLVGSNFLIVPTQVLSDGKTLLYFGDVGGTTGFDIFTVPIAPGARPTPVIQGPFSEVEPSLSSDGRWLAYASTETGGYDVFVQPYPPTGAKWQVSNGGGRQPVWRRDGRELFFATNDRKLYAVDIRLEPAFEFGAPRLLFEMPTNTISVRNSYVPSRDGQRFLVNKLLDTSVPPINVVVNWAETLKK